jgi:hypothetical protein
MPAVFASTSLVGLFFHFPPQLVPLVPLKNGFSVAPTIQDHLGIHSTYNHTDTSTINVIFSGHWWHGA